MWFHWFHRYTAWQDIKIRPYYKGNYQDKVCTICFKVKRRDV